MKDIKIDLKGKINVPLDWDYEGDDEIGTHDDEHEIEGDTWSLTFRVTATITRTFRRGNWEYPDEVTKSIEDVEVSDIKVLDYSGNNEVILTDEEFEELVTDIKDNIEYV